MSDMVASLFGQVKACHFNSRYCEFRLPQEARP
jgi:hypothetical protein